MAWVPLVAALLPAGRRAVNDYHPASLPAGHGLPSAVAGGPCGHARQCMHRGVCSCCVPGCSWRRCSGPPGSFLAFVALWLCWGLLPRPVVARGCRAAALSSPLHHQFESILFIFSSAMRMAENRALRASIHASYIDDSDPEGMKSQLCENGLS